jgi:hypothetical protein
MEEAVESGKLRAAVTGEDGNYFNGVPRHFMTSNQCLISVKACGR